MENGQAFVAVCRTLCCFYPMEEDEIVLTDVPLTVEVEVQPEAKPEAKPVLTLTKPEETEDWNEYRPLRLTLTPCSCCLETDLQTTWCKDCWEDWCDSQEYPETEEEVEMVVENQTVVVKNRDVRFPDEVWAIVVSYLEVKWTSLYQEAHRQCSFWQTSLDTVAFANKIYYENQIHCHAELQISTEVVWSKKQSICYNMVTRALQDENIVAINWVAKDKYYNARIEKLRKLCDEPLEIRETNREAYVLLRASATQGFYKNDKRKTRVSHPLESLEIQKIGHCYIFGREFQCLSNSGKKMLLLRATEALTFLEGAGFSFHEYL